MSVIPAPTDAHTSTSTPRRPSEVHAASPSGGGEVQTGVRLASQPQHLTRFLAGDRLTGTPALKPLLSPSGEIIMTAARRMF